MSAIDWSKAPEGATHFDPNPNDPVWVRPNHSGRGWDFWGKCGGNWIYWGSVAGAEKFVPRPIAWSGEGLPPVGAVCEFAGGTPCPYDPFDKDLKEGMQVTIIAHFKSGDFTLAAFTFDPQNPDRGMVQVEQGNFGCFRPIRTAEQIAAEERAQAIEEMWSVYWKPEPQTAKEALGLLWDAGYRKQEAAP